MPYVAVDEARKALVPEGETLKVMRRELEGAARPAALKSFDFVIYGQGSNLLVEVKGRRIARRTLALAAQGELLRAPTRGRLESWVTLEDIESLGAWGKLFGPEFSPAFVFVYWCDEQPPDVLFEEIFTHRGRWYALRAISLTDYAGAMRTRSTRWRTVHLPSAAFDRLSHPFAPPGREASLYAEAAPGPPMLDPL